MKNTIKTILLAATILLSCGYLSAKEKIVVKKSGGGKEGYKNVEETHIKGKKHLLICDGQGREACVWGQGIPSINDQRLVAVDKIISERINANDYSGVGNLEGSNVLFYWNYNQSLDLLTYTISQDSPDYELE